VGGTGFYADPVDLTQASTVTLSYKVFFPADFDFVMGGKLPGLFGGRPGCSGGDAGTDCFSTRFMVFIVVLLFNSFAKTVWESFMFI
jgi:hypothetical protein